ncbi:hypothetical protein SARC_10084 [Sphaeroforma arctica JP610]|uniref:Transporter n=1 Tax=Sphaeroforma arctica JP610 TaxID=667725 RepID=A0A0L0FKZ4_9EUKA|nr:hypothetical protein SARC_10084 [Sphaeroforma arctica JP610]KNC77457.1 hypothetical protein SARC_10084 [Sphaeroforma arctica JP610]|eukprot:XP_014151359.1 hypothetical protein SARC_10084 [Sphaeroforma arctica JP610]
MDNPEEKTTTALNPTEKKLQQSGIPDEASQAVEVGNRDLDDDIRSDNDIIPDDTWGNRWEFILANVGAAIGLGNFWRFPFLAFDYGGGAFFIPYIIALFTTGIPLTLLEMTLSQYCQQAMCRSFGNLNERFVGMGIAALWICFIIVTYYSVIIGWSNVYLIQSFYTPMPWSARGLPPSEMITVPSNYFYDDILHLNDAAVVELGEFVWFLFLGTFVVWAAVFLILFKGVAVVGKAVWFTVLLPVFTLVVLIIYGATLDGAGDGVVKYIGTWDMSVLENGQIWVDAFGQIFFSLGISTGIMSAFASHNGRQQNIVQDGIVVAMLNSSFSFVAGFAVFLVAGHFKYETGLTWDELQGVLGGPSLIFILYPSALSLTSGWWGNVMCILFFFTVFMLGIDSAFALTESIFGNLREVRLFDRLGPLPLLAFIVTACMALATLYCFGWGLYLLDVVDAYINIGLLAVGFTEAFVVGWVYKRNDAAEIVGSKSMLALELGCLGGFLAFATIGISVGNSTDLGLGYLALASILPALAIIAIGFVLCGTFSQVGFMKGIKTASYHGLGVLIFDLNEVLTRGTGKDNWKLPAIWGLALKFFVTPLVAFLLALKFNKFGIDSGYGGYIMGYQAFGIVVLLVCAALGFAGIVLPQIVTVEKKFPETSKRHPKQIVV